MAKKTTFTCKICGQEHAGLICTKFSSVRVLPAAQRKVAVAGLLAAPKPEKAKKAKKAKRTKKRTPKKARKGQPIAPPAGNGPAPADKKEDKS